MPDDLAAMIDRLRRMRARPEVAGRDWYQVQSKATSRAATIRIYDDIGWMGTSARSFADELAALDVDHIDLHLNSPGGDAWDGIAIYNALRGHQASITVTVDALAASAASVIAMAGDRVRMNRGAQMMIHDAWGLVIGSAADMTDAASMFDKISDSLAGIYAARAGGTLAEWRQAMGKETWYTAAEAVDAGLADETLDEAADDAPQSRWDLKAYAFAYAGRDAAPPPHKPKPAPAPAGAASSPRKEGAGMDPAKIREALGLQPDASDDEVRTALASAGLAPTPPEPDPGPEPAPTPTPKPGSAVGTMTIDVSAWDEQQKRIKRLEAAENKRLVEERDQVISAAVSQGKFPPARKEHWARLWDADPEGTRQVIASLARDVVPMQALGYDGDRDAVDAEFDHLFPPTYSTKGA